MRGPAHAIALLVLFWFSTLSAFAHAFLESARPPVGSTVQTSPAQIAITFTEQVEPAFSTIIVQNQSGARVNTGNVHLPPDDPKQLVTGLKSLPPGTYTVVWHVTPIDTHKTEGSNTFTVARW